MSTSTSYRERGSPGMAHAAVRHKHLVLTTDRLRHYSVSRDAFATEPQAAILAILAITPCGLINA